MKVKFRMSLLVICFGSTYSLKRKGLSTVILALFMKVQVSLSLLEIRFESTNSLKKRAFNCHFRFANESKSQTVPFKDLF